LIRVIWPLLFLMKRREAEIDFGSLVQKGDWGREKHTPLITFLGEKDSVLEIEVSVGEKMPHPNTAEHHIGCIEVYFLPTGEKFPYQIVRVDFLTHGASVQGPNTSTIYTEPKINFSFKTEKPGVILALSYCNIHGLWQNSKELTL